MPIVQVMLNDALFAKAQQNGNVLEIVERDDDGAKFIGFDKCKFLGELDSADAAEVAAKGAKQLLQAVNMALAAVNLAVNVAGFVIIHHDLKQLENTIDGMQEDIKGLVFDSQDHSITKYKAWIMHYGMFADKVQNKQNLDLDWIQEQIIEGKNFMESLKNTFLKKAGVDRQLVLNMIISMLLPYTSMLLTFVKVYYLRYGNLPGNYHAFLGVYDELLDYGFLNQIQDYLFLEQEASNRETQLLLNEMHELFLQHRRKVNDQTTLLEYFTAEEYQEVENYMAKRAENMQMPKTALNT